MFFFKNGGINVIAEDVDLNTSKKTVCLKFKKDFGILNGGHTQKAILDCKEKNDIDDDAIVRVEVIKWDLNNSTIAELASAKNSSSKVKNFSKANKIGLFEPIKLFMKPVYDLVCLPEIGAGDPAIVVSLWCIHFRLSTPSVMNFRTVSPELKNVR